MNNTGVNGWENCECDKEYEENIETLRETLLEDHPVRSASFSGSSSCYILLILLPLNLLIIVAIKPLK